MQRSDLTRLSVDVSLTVKVELPQWNTECVVGYISLEFGAHFSARDTDMGQHTETT